MYSEAAYTMLCFPPVLKRSVLITVIIVYLEWIVELGVCVNDAVS